MNSDQPSYGWGAITPEKYVSSRVRIDFELSRATRYFNEVAFPGIGGASFVRQFGWGAAAIVLAQETGKSPMRVAEAIEALACWIALFRAKGYEYSTRIRGRRKLNDERFDYPTLSKRTNYVTQPMRIGTTAGLRGLGLASGPARRFNSLELTPDGHALANLMLSSPTETKGETVAKWLVEKWLNNKKLPQRIPDAVKRALLPGVNGKDAPGALSTERAILCGLIEKSPDRLALKTALRNLKSPWTEGGLGSGSGRTALLGAIVDKALAERVKAAFEFERMRAAALALTRSLVNKIKTGTPVRLDALVQDNGVKASVGRLHSAAVKLAAQIARAQLEQREAITFCAEQSTASSDERLAALIRRLPGVFVLRGSEMSQGLLYRGELALDSEIADAEASIEQHKVAADPTPTRLFQAYHLLNDCGAIR